MRINRWRHFIAERDRELAGETRDALVATLFGSPASLAIGALAGTAVAVLVAAQTSDTWLGAVAFAIGLVGCFRVLHLAQAKVRIEARDASLADERIYEIGAWLYSALLGLLTFSTFLRALDAELHVVVACTATGYAAGIAARNAGRPAIAIGQMVLAAAPTTICAALVGGAAYWLLAVVNVLFMLALGDITAKTYAAVFNAIHHVRTRENQWKETLDSLPQMVWSTDSSGVADYHNKQWLEFTGVDLDTPGVRRIDLVHPDDAAPVMEHWRASVAAAAAYEAQYRVRDRSGNYRWVLSRGVPYCGSDGRVMRWYGTSTDIHDRVNAQEALEESEQLSRSIIEASPDCISILDENGNVLSANRAALQAYGIDDERDLIGRSWGHRLQPEARTDRDAALAAARIGQVGRLTLSLPNAEGELRWYESLVAPLGRGRACAPRFMVISRDITEQKAIENKVRWAAGHDALTRLPNRSLFQQQVEEAISTGPRQGFALLLLDIDDFKQINDTLGHDAGDALLCAAADRLRAAVRDTDFVARLGGDEFAVILRGVGTELAARAAAAKILDSLREPWIHAGRVYDCRASIGASLFPKNGTEASALLKNADMALYSAKLNGRGQLAVFRSGMRAEMRKRSSMLDLARTALGNDLIRPYYQPKVDLATGQVTGFEALLRWRHPTRGAQPPSSIAAAFEDLELAAQLTDRMITRIVSDMGLWLDQGVAFGHVAVNASAADFKKMDFADNLLKRLQQADIPPACVQIEVTETVFLGRGADYVERALKTLSAHGIKIALDDFGTGYASLSHLKQFPVDIVKIDRSFVRDLQVGAGNAAIVRAVLNLGRSLDLDVVAEGIETPAQLAYLLSHGCRTGQGYYFGKAVPASRVPALVRPAKQLRAA
ncbi:MAG TPA: EAL domain-containing protein [Allosphingosinicella sp.]